MAATNIEQVGPVEVVRIRRQRTEPANGPRAALANAFRPTATRVPSMKLQSIGRFPLDSGLVVAVRRTARQGISGNSDDVGGVAGADGVAGAGMLVYAGMTIVGVGIGAGVHGGTTGDGLAEGRTDDGVGTAEVRTGG